jgi:hypothetical protein
VLTTASSTGISGSAISTGTVGVSVGGTGVTTTTAYGVLAGGTTATGAFQNIGTGTAAQVLTSNGPGVLPSFQTLSIPAAGQIQTQIFTAPGTWTKPSSVTQVRVTVIGGGGGSGATNSPGATSGSTSSFGALVSATGGSTGSTSSGSTQSGAQGSGTVTTGTALLTTSVAGAVVNTSFNTGSSITGSSTYGIISGLSNNITTAPAAVTWSPSSNVCAGARGGSAGVQSPTAGSTGTLFGGGGGVAIAICPVSAPVAITVGPGGIGSPGNSVGGGVGGVVAVEFVG